ncbi:TonB-dependent receptor [hydrothermal vent metagenome]|uniref:TonB-dependent receptor n=1 Tax=hydrothermal vent metagenome TaxID=652676 RepID=A0A1W1C2F6_9ZZZZ
MRKSIYLSLVCIVSLQASEQLADINVTERTPVNTKVVKNVSGEEVKSADLADALSRKVPSVSLIRRSWIANDITLRGQKRDNINVTIDGAKICGACVNRMDPPISHVVTHAIDDIEIKEGPFDVEEFGTLSGSVKVTTLKPSKEITGEISLNGGSFGYKKASGTISGGTDKVRLLFSASTEEGEQYEDGNGDNFSEQLANYTEGNPNTAKFNYAPEYKDMDAFKKSMYMGKVFVDITDDQELKFSYTANRSKDVLYPSSKMDADYDDSDMLNLEYSINNLSSFSKKLEFQLYNSEVDHPMSTRYRAIAKGSGKYMTHHLTTEMRGAKLKNSTDAFGGELTYGVDTSQRNWDGEYTVTTLDGSKPVMTIGKSIDDVDTENVGIFFKGKKSFGAVEVEAGARYDDTSIDTASTTEKDRDYKSSSASLFATYKANKDTKLFAGVGKSNRVPDARELYNVKYNTKIKPPKRVLNGNPSLNQTTNYELDIGVERYLPNGQIKFKTFYSKLKDYIYYNGSLKKNNFENIDATIYGAELSGTYLATDSLYFDAGLSYKKGEKDTMTTGQRDKDLADISPLKLNASVTYDYDDSGNMQLSFVAVDDWKDIDSDNGEQKLAGYGVVNFKTSREFDNGLILLFGVDNLFDKTYATTNTYKDLILMTDGSDTMLINEPGRYMYLNATYQF